MLNPTSSSTQKSTPAKVLGFRGAEARQTARGRDVRVLGPVRSAGDRSAAKGAFGGDTGTLWASLYLSGMHVAACRGAVSHLEMLQKDRPLVRPLLPPPAPDLD